MEFSCTTREAEGRLTITVVGAVDLASYPRLHADAEIWTNAQTDLVLDCSGVTFMDSMGLRLLAELLHGTAEAGHEFALAAPSPPVIRVLELAGARGVFTQVDAAPQPAS